MSLTMTPTNFRQWRQRLGLTQVRAAEALGVTERAIRNYESGARKPSKGMVKLMAFVEQSMQERERA